MLAAPLLLLTGTSSAEPGPYPGLPVVDDPGPPFPDTVGQEDDRNLLAWLNAPFNGLTGSAAAEQWVRLPARALASNTSILTCSSETGENPCPFPLRPGEAFYNGFSVAAFMVSPDGAPQPYGYGAVIPVNTVAFGVIPVQAEIQLAQVPGADGLPVPLRADFSDRIQEIQPDGSQLAYVDAGRLTGDVVLRVSSVVVDGVDVGLGPGCASGTIELDLTSEAASGPVADVYTWLDPQRSLYGYNGGGFNGDVDIPRFSGCTTSTGDDLSDVLTAVLAGPGNPVSLQYGAMFCFGEFTEGGQAKPTAPGADLPEEAGCAQYELAPGGNWWAIPLEREYPEYAPSDLEQ